MELTRPLLVWNWKTKIAYLITLNPVAFGAQNRAKWGLHVTRTHPGPPIPSLEPGKEQGENLLTIIIE